MQHATQMLRGASIADGKMSTSMWAKATGLRHQDVSETFRW